jgi:nicotinamide mononucleotide (NMN) deamidase PncC
MFGLLANSRSPHRVDELFQEPVALTEELAWSARNQAGSDLGLALHAVPDPARQLENMSGGQTFISVTDGERFLNQTTSIAGRGAHDRSRMTLSALDLLRSALLKGME